MCLHEDQSCFPGRQGAARRNEIRQQGVRAKLRSADRGGQAKATLGAFAMMFALAAVGCGGSSSSTAAADTNPDFGSNVTIIDPSMTTDEINTKLVAIAAASTGYDEVRNAVYFLPGTYGSAAGADDPTTATGFISSSVGYNETVQGLGSAPGDVVINGNLTVNGNLRTFWRSLANVKINPIQADEAAHTLRWSTSQACPLRRVDIAGNLDVKGAAVTAGNLLENSRVSGQVDGGMGWNTDSVIENTPTEYYFRDCDIGSLRGHNVQWLFTGVPNAPATDFALGTATEPGCYTALPTTPVSREVPFLFLDGESYKVFVPNAVFTSSGHHWGTTAADGETLALSSFFIAKPTDDITTINAALANGKNLLLTPGIYKITAPIQVTKANTVVMGMGLASVMPVSGTAAIAVGDVPNVVIASLTIENGTQNSDVLLQIGTRGGNSNAGLAAKPTTVADVYAHLGRMVAGGATTTVEVNQDYTLIDNEWTWRADISPDDRHGWTVNPGDHGLVVNADNVTGLSLWNEHYEKEQVVWAGNGGTVLFSELEPPHDVPSQAVWMNNGLNGYPNYLVTQNVTSHSCTGMGSLHINPVLNPAPVTVYQSSMVAAPDSPDVTFRSMAAIVIALGGGFENIINTTGGSVDPDGPASFAYGFESIGEVANYPE
nr:hypothetical protein [uncultured Holophaga sp.]